MCDLRYHRPLALLPNRSPETLAEWLKQPPHIQVVSYDGFTSFRQGISDASSSILQVYDRWYFIKNARKHLDTFLLSAVPSTITWNETSSISIETALTKAEKIKLIRQKRKWDLIQEIKKAHRSGKSINSLTKEYHLNWRTIKKYMKMMTPPTTNRWRISPAQGCLESIMRLEKEGKTLKTIDPLIRKKADNGTFSAVCTLVGGIRRTQKHANHPSPTYQIARKRLVRWFWIHPNHLNTSERRD
ncbi:MULTISPECIES: transposase, partial [Bacillus cereus group]